MRKPAAMSIKKTPRQSRRGRIARLLADSINLRDVMREHVEAVVKAIGPEAAWPRLGISRTTLYTWRREWKKQDASRARAREKANARIDRLLAGGTLTKGEGERE